MPEAEVAKLGRDFAVTAHVERYDVVEAGGGKQIDALKARLSSSGTHVEWTIRVVGQQREPHRLRKRFNEFVTLHEFLRRRLISTPAELPSKSLVRQFNAEYLESRKVALQQYLAALCARRDAMNCPEVQRFLGLPELDVGGEAAQVAEVQEGSFGVVSVSFDAVQGLLLLGSTSASLRSKLDNAVGGMKLPWGGSQSPQQGPPTSQMTLWRQSPGQLRFDVATACKYTPSLSGVAMCHTSDRGCLCLCGLGDGRVGHFSDRGRDSTAASAALPLLCHTAAVEALEVDEAEETLFSVSRDMSLIAYDLRRQTVRCEARTQSAVNSMRYCGTQRRLFCAMADGRVSVWDTSSVPIRQLALVPDVAAGRCPPVVSMDYDAALETLFTATKGELSLYALKSSSTGCWGRKTGAVSTSAAAAPTALAWMRSSRELLAGLAGGSVAVFDAETGEASFAFPAHADEVTAVVWLDAQRRLLTASKDKTVKIWDFPSLRRVPIEDIQTGAFSDLAPRSAPASRPSAPAAPAAPVARAPADPGGGLDALAASFGGLSRPGLGGGAAAAAPAAAPRLGPLGGPGGLAPGPRPEPAAAAPARGLAPQATPPLAPAAAAPAAQRPAPAAPAPQACEDSDDDLAGWAS